MLSCFSASVCWKVIPRVGKWRLTGNNALVSRKKVNCINGGLKGALLTVCILKNVKILHENALLLPKIFRPHPLLFRPLSQISVSAAELYGMFWLSNAFRKFDKNGLWRRVCFLSYN